MSSPAKCIVPATLVLSQLLLVASVGTSGAAPIFGADYVSFATGHEPGSIAAGDLNGDGRMDLVTANRGSNTASILMGNGDGSFGVNTDYDTERWPSSVVVADLNGDGPLDLVTANDGGTMSVLLGHGDGTFGTKADYFTYHNTSCAGIGDLNGDGHLDIALTDYYAGTVSIFLGNGDGTFRQKSDYVTGSRPTAVAIADVSGDGKLDLAVTNAWSNTVSVFLGSGDGTLMAKADYVAGDTPVSVAIGDLNDDGWPDLATANENEDESGSILLGNGDGTFGVKTGYRAGSFASSVALGDLDGGGRLDLAITNALAVSVLLGNGDGSVGLKTDYETGSWSGFVIIKDLNSDGRPDLAVSNADGVSVHLNIGSPPSPMARVSVAPIRGPLGTIFSQPGTGFTPDSDVELHFRKPDGLEYDPPYPVEHTDASGEYSHTYNSSTASQYGAYYYWAIDIATARQSNTVSFRLDRPATSPTVSVSPTSGPAGTSFSQPGAGFTPNADVELHFRKPDGLEYDPPYPVEHTDASGSFAHTFPSSLASQIGTYEYWAIDLGAPGGMRSNTVSFRLDPPLTPHLLVGPTEIQPGASINLSGDGFSPGGPIDIRFVRPDGRDVLGTSLATPWAADSLHSTRFRTRPS